MTATYSVFFHSQEAPPPNIKMIVAATTSEVGLCADYPLPGIDDLFLPLFFTPPSASDHIIAHKNSPIK